MPGMSTMRPGVFSQYTVTNLYIGRKSEKNAALLAGFSSGEAVWVSSYEQAAAVINPADTTARNCLRILFEAGVNKILCVPVAADASPEQVEQALLKTQGQDVYALIADVSPQHFCKVRDCAAKCSGEQHERIAFCGMSNVLEAAAMAQELGSERIALTCPASMPKGESDTAKAKAVYTACALAGAVLAMKEPTESLSGRVIETLCGLDKPLSSQEVEALLAAGVTPFETVGGNVECIRAVTARTKTNGLPDRSFAPIGTVMVIDDVMISVRELLKTRLKGLKNTPQAFASIASQVTVLLSAKRDEGVITSFEIPTAKPLEGDSSVCVVELAFNVAYAVNQIHIKAHVIV